MSHLKQFGKYEILRKLSRSLTDVYLARHSETNVPVVLKLVEQSHDEFTQLVMEAERRGAVLQRQLHATDPRILEVFDFGEEQNCFFVAMEYCEGKTLSELVHDEGPVDAKRAATYAAEIANQLKTLHAFVSDLDGRQTAVVHGDIKPSNVQIGANGDVRLLDFGIAKVITLTRKLTHHNLGSPTYCSPERLSSGQVDAQADLWALGVTLYEMVAGIPPYQAQNTRKLENLIQSRQPPRALAENCPVGLKAIIFKSLAPQLTERYTSADAIESDLRAFVADTQTAAETELRSAWIAAPTIARYPEASRVTRLIAKTRTYLAKPRRTRIIVRKDFKHAAIALVAGVLFALFVLMPSGYLYRFHHDSQPIRQPHNPRQSAASIASDWSLYQRLRRDNEFLGPLSPVSSLREPLNGRLLAAANEVIDGYRVRPDARLDWSEMSKARTALLHALELNPNDSSAKGKLALCDAYINLLKHPRLPEAATSLREFRKAASLLPHSPDPHLGMARVYVYSYRNLGAALAELRKAQQLDYHLGPRELSEEADGYLFRAEWELMRARCTIPKLAKRRWVSLARDDLARARTLYLPVAAASSPGPNFQRLQRARIEQIRLETEPDDVVSRKQRLVNPVLSSRRWQ